MDMVSLYFSTLDDTVLQMRKTEVSFRRNILNDSYILTQIKRHLFQPFAGSMDVGIFGGPLMEMDLHFASCKFH